MENVQRVVIPHSIITIILQYVCSVMRAVDPVLEVTLKIAQVVLMFQCISKKSKLNLQLEFVLNNAIRATFKMMDRYVLLVIHLA